MKYVFYITNHGFGHASRNVPIIENLLTRDVNGKVIIKSDFARCDFLKRNLTHFSGKIEYISDVNENGLVLQQGKMSPDIDKMRKVIESDFLKWDEFVERETNFLRSQRPDIVIADVVCWAIKAAFGLGIKTLLIGNFTWSQMYKSFYGEEIWGPYQKYYEMADVVVFYEIHDPQLDLDFPNCEMVSLVSRKVDWDEVANIKNRYDNPIVFVSNGASADLEGGINVENLPYDFLVTRGLHLIGANVHELPRDMINTPDYIAASEFVISKGGWSTVAEILLQKKKCALIFRGNNSEDNNTKRILESRNQCVSIYGEDMMDVEKIIVKIKELNPQSYDMYSDDTERICNIIFKLSRGNEREEL